VALKPMNSTQRSAAVSGASSSFPGRSSTNSSIHLGEVQTLALLEPAREVGDAGTRHTLC